MALTVQNLRAVGPGVEPSSLLPGQLCFNLSDRIVFVGDGSNTKTSFDGSVTPGVPGEGWYAMPMNLSDLGNYYVVNPEVYGSTPQNRYNITWNSADGYAVWAPQGGIVYPTSNFAVAAAAGSTLTEKINNAIEADPLEGDTAIVVGYPGDEYEGSYFYDQETSEWVFGAHYAFPQAVDVPYDNATSGLVATEVQGAIDEVVADFVPNSSFENAGDLLVGTGAGTYAALPEGAANYILQSNGDGTLSWVENSVGDVTSVSATSPVTVNNTDPQNPIVGIDAATTSQPGAVQLNNTVNSTSVTQAATANAVKTTYDLADAALPKSGGTMTGFINFTNNQLVDAGTF